MSKGKVVVRPAVPDDRDAIAALVRGLNEFQNDPVENFTAASVDRDIFGSDPSIEALIGELDGRPVAYAFFHVAYESGWATRGLYVSDLFVAPEARRHGVARALMAAIAREPKRGASGIFGGRRAPGIRRRMNSMPRSARTPKM